MRVTHVTGSASSLGGGIALALRALACEQAAQGMEIRVVAPDDGGDELSGWPPGQPELLVARRPGPLLWGVGMRRELERSGPSLLHAHGLWGQASIIGARLGSRDPARVVSPHGMLDPWALRNGALRKRLAMGLFERRNLESARCLHALCRSEAESIRALGIDSPVAVIPNGVDLVKAEKLKTEKLKSEKKTLLFLGRLHPKKGLVNALRAWAEVAGAKRKKEKGGEWRFVIAGWNQGGHEAALKRLCDELGVGYAEMQAEEWLSQDDSSLPSSVLDSSVGSGAPASRRASVCFVGPAFGEQKDALLRRADAFILPSFSEGLPVAVLEAWAYGLPVLMTDLCNLPEGFEADAALRIGSGAPPSRRASGMTAMPITDGLRLLMEMDDADRFAMGRNGRALVERRFTWPQVAAQMKEVYEWVLGGGDRPGWVG